MYLGALRLDNHGFHLWLLSRCCVSASAQVKCSPVLKFLQDELIGLKSRWLRVLALLTCLGLALVVAQQRSAIEAQGSLIRTLSGDSNELQKARNGDHGQARVSVYITDWHILEPAAKQPEAKAAPAPVPEPPPSPKRMMHQI